MHSICRLSPQITQTKVDVGAIDDDDDDNDMGSGSGDFAIDLLSQTDSSASIPTTRINGKQQQQQISTSSLQTHHRTRDNMYSVSSEIVSNLTPINSGPPMLTSSTNTFNTPISILLGSVGSIANRRDKGFLRVSSPPTSIGKTENGGGPDASEAYARAGYNHKNGAWLETRARRIMGNVKKSEERSRQLLLCEEAGGGELCRMLFKGHLNE